MPKFSVNRIMPMVFFIKYYASSYKVFAFDHNQVWRKKK